MRIDCGRCALRPWTAGTSLRWVLHADNREVWRSMRDRFPRPYTRADAEWWVSSVRRENPLGTFAIEVDGEAVGVVGFTPGDDVERRSAEIGYWLGEVLWGRGIAAMALRAATGYGFEALTLTRMFAVPFANNPASARVLEKAGYAREGLMRRSAIKEGVVPDRVLYAIADRVPARAHES